MDRSNFHYRLILLVLSVAVSQPAFTQEANAEYSVRFTGNWTQASTPGGVVGSAHFTTIAGGKHNSSVSFWAPGEKATSGMESLAELGSTSGFISEINASANTDASFTSSVGFGGTGTSTFTLNMKRTHPLVTLATMIGPSPDWFVGLNSYSLLDSSSNWVSSVTVNLYPYDAGTEDGENFTLSNPATNPQGVITSIRGIGKFSNAPMATISFTRQAAPPPPAPTITAIERPSNVSRFTNADSVTWLVTFSETVQNVSASDFVVNGTTATATSVSRVTGSTTQYQVVVSGGNLANLDATISLALSSSQNITNSSNVALSATLPSGIETYTIDNTAPRVLSVSPTTADESPITVTITFNESLLTGSFTDQGDVTSDDASVSAPSVFGASFRVTVTPNNTSQASDIALTIPAGAATDVAGNRSREHEITIAYTPAVVVSPPIVNSVEATSPDGLYHSGEEVEIAVTFSQPVIVSGSPSLLLQFDAGTRNALYDRGSESSSLVFVYTFVDGDATADLDYASTQSLVLGGGSILGTSNQLADLTLPSPGASGSLSQTSDIRTSGRQDAMPTFGNVDVDDEVLMMNQAVDPIQLPFATGGDTPLQYALEPTLPAGLELDPATHQISGTPTEVFDMTTFSWSATDVDGDTVKLTFTIMVLPQLPLQFPSSESIHDQVALQNDAIDAIDLPNARGGVGTISYSIKPELPAGLELNVDARQITGTPTEPISQTTFAWRATDEEGTEVELTFQLTVREDFQPSFDVALTPIDLAFIQDSPVTSFTLPSATNGNGQLTYELDSQLPKGLVLNLSTFDVSGIPSIPQSRTEFRWTATDEDGDSATFSFHITVLDDLMPIFSADASISDREFISDSAIDPIRLPNAMGGNGSLSYDLSPDLPSGLVLDMTSFEISGTPDKAMPRTEYTWSVQDIDGDATTLSFNLEVIQDEQPAFDERISEKEYTARTPIDAFTLPRASGGNGQLAYELSPQLPSGINFGPATASISGTPTDVFETTLFSWTAKDIDGDTAHLTFNITVLPRTPLHFPTTASIEDQVFLQNDAIATVELPSATGGFGDFTYSLLPELPAGLSLNRDARQITGTPSEVLAQTTFTWRVTDEDGVTADVTFLMTVLEDFQPVFDPDLASIDRIFTQDSPITPLTLPSASSGNGQLMHMLGSELPEGLVLDAASFTISGVPTVPQMRTALEWRATDTDGDTTTFSFYLTVIEDFTPSFADDAFIADREFISDSAIEPLTLPSAMGGNGSLSYALSPVLPDGLELDSTSFAINGTPTTAQEQTQFSWTVSDEDGDSTSLMFHLTVLQDTLPVFTSQVDDKVFVMGSPIEPFALPEASGGNGQLTYELSPQPQNGLSFDAGSSTISGTPLATTPASTFTWSATDIDGDATMLAFSITVNPIRPEIVGSIANVRLLVGGSSRTVDATTAIGGQVDAWSVDTSNTEVVAVSATPTGVVTLTPLFEGQSSVMVTASNVTGSTTTSFMVNVVTDNAENDQIDLALSLKAGAVLSSAMNVFKTRTHSHDQSVTGAESSAVAIDGAFARGGETWPNHHNSRATRFDHLSAYNHHPIAHSTNPLYGNDFVPLSFSHTSTQWRMWGAFDLQNFSTDAPDNEVDGTLSSLYVGADLAVNENVYAGLAVARHGGSSSYEFSSADAKGEGEIDTTLLGFYPYLQAGDGNRFSMFLVGGIGSGDSQIDRRHTNGIDQDSDADMTLFAGGLDYVVLRRANLDFAIVADAGFASITTAADSGVLFGRDASSAKSSIGGSVAFKPQVEAGSLITSLDVRLARGEEGDASGTGYELGGNLRYTGDHIDFMLDGRTSTRSADADVQRSSLSARLRYKAKRDGSGLTIALSPRWQDGSLLSLREGLDQSVHVSRFVSPQTGRQRSLEGEVGFGFWSNNETALLKPRIAWQRFDSKATVLKVGTHWKFSHTRRTGSQIGLDLLRNSFDQQGSAYGLSARIEVPL